MIEEVCLFNVFKESFAKIGDVVVMDKPIHLNPMHFCQMGVIVSNTHENKNMVKVIGLDSNIKIHQPEEILTTMMSGKELFKE